MTDTLDRPLLTREERTALRLQRYRRRRLIGWIVLASTVLLSSGGAYVLWGTSALGLTGVEVSFTNGPDAPGVSPQPDQTLRTAVEQAIAVPSGTPLIRIDADEVEARIEAVPTVARASVSRHWPGTLLVSVTPRAPIAVVAANTAVYLMDGTGLPYQKMPDKPAGLITLRLATPGPGDPATMAGLAVIQALPAGVAAQVASVTARSPYDISLALTDGRTVLWGGPDQSARKVQVLPAILAQPGTEFDISDPELVTVR